MKTQNVRDKFTLYGKVCIVTGGAGFLGQQHAEAIIEAGGWPVILDINKINIDIAIQRLNKKYKKKILGFVVDITSKKDLESVKISILSKYRKIDVLINNAANNPKVESKDSRINWTRFENFPIEMWNNDFAVGLTGAFFASQVFGNVMVRQKSGVILNISSDLGIIAPDQRIYRKAGLSEDQQPAKPVTYSVVKHGLIGLTKYLATYWADRNIRVNAICPGGIYNGQDPKFVKKLINLIPLGRMAAIDEYKATIVYLISDASSYMTGSVVSIDGGRTCW